MTRLDVFLIIKTRYLPSFAYDEVVDVSPVDNG